MNPRPPTLRPTLLLMVASSCISPAAAWGATVHSYRVSVDTQLNELAVEARLSGAVAALKARQFNAGRYLRRPRLCAGEPLRPRRNTLPLPARPAQCVRYEVDLKEMARRRAYRRGGLRTLDRLASPAAWLWRPSMAPHEELRVSFELPDGINVSVPWEPLGEQVENAYRIAPSPESSNAVAVFGGFDYQEVAVPGAVLRVSLVRGAQRLASEPIITWLEAAAMNVAAVFGRFPNPSPQVIVVPVPGYGGRSAVPFGRVIRDGGEAVQLFVAADRPLQDYLNDWTATHEFSHLLLPYVDRKWISEGFASYYQNILMARGGAYSEQRAWQKLHEGFQRGRRSAPSMSPNEVSRGGRAGLMKVYWSGAAIALLADVALRSRNTGQSLDTVLDKLQTCCLPAERMWSGRELFARLDQLSATTVFADLYDRHADQGGFPPVETLYENLGIRLAGDRVTLTDDAPLALLRQDITSRAVQPQLQTAAKELQR